jgi:signal transduction histidine kinase/ActR/RegA family two-component response regulator
MGIPPAWYAAAAATTLINGSALGYVAWRERNHAVRLWSWAWFAWAGAIIPMMVLGATPHPLAAVVCGLFWVVSALCFLAGTYALTERRMPSAWHVVAGTCALVALALGVGPAGQVGMVPLVAFQSVGLGTTGILLIRSASRYTGAWLAGIALVTFGLHLLDAPLVAHDANLMVWGFVLALALEVLIALGMLVLHYERARDQLLTTQRTLDEARRTEALGRISGGVAHDFNNLLAVMQGHLDLMRLKTGRYSAEESLAAIEQAVEQAKRLTTQLLAFGRRSVVQNRSIDVRKVVADSLELLRKVIPESIEIDLKCADGDYRASMDRGLLEQIVLNLVTNGRDAIRDHGSIEVTLARSEEPSPRVVLAVRDDGEGMDDTILARAFDPFFTTKAAGTGLGLASVKGAVAQLGGVIDIRSRPGHGTTFEVALPWTPPEDVAVRPSGALELARLRVLLVDDEARVREVTAAMLESAGHQVDQAADGAQAVDLLGERSYDVVLSDVVMPQMGGKDLLERVSSLRPAVPIVLMSAYPPGPVDTSRAHFLPKPFQREALLDAVSRAAALRSHDLRGSATAGE